MENLPPHIKKMQKTVEAADAKFVEETNIPGEDEKKPPILVKTEEKPPEKPPVQVEKTQKKDEVKEVKTKKKQPFEEDTAEAWKARYYALKGKFDKEVPSLQTQVKNATKELVQVRSLIGDLQSKIDNQKKATQSIQPKKINIPDDLSKLLSEEDLSYLEEEGIGQKSVNIMGKLVSKFTEAKAQTAAPQQLTPELEDLKREVRDIRQTRVNEFEKKYTKAVPDWSEINTSNAFNFEFLPSQVPFAGITWHQALNDAQSELDADKVIAILKKFKEIHGKEEQVPYQINPDELIEPSSTVHTKVETEPHEKTWTLAEAQKVYDDYKNGKISEKEFAKLEAQIWKANEDGHIEET
jgi:hypothetical protein